MMRGLLLTAAGAVVAPLAGGLVRGLVQTQRLGPGAAHPEVARPDGARHSRRTLLRWATVGALAVGSAQASLVFVRFFWPNKTDASGAEIVATRLGALPPVDGEPLRHQAGRFYLIHNPEGLLAFSWTCTHLGCTVPWNTAEGQFHCPCHESQFNRRGEVVYGPATRPLDLLPIRIDGDQVVVDTGTIIRRTAFDPSQVTPVS